MSLKIKSDSEEVILFNIRQSEETYDHFRSKYYVYLPITMTKSANKPLPTLPNNFVLIQVEYLSQSIKLNHTSNSATNQLRLQHGPTLFLHLLL